MASDSFSSLSVSKGQVANLNSLGYTKMTPVQAKSLPHVLKGRDLIARAKTGSGKTAAFGIGIIEQLNPRFFGVQAMIMCPTRELAEQVSKELRRLARGAACSCTVPSQLKRSVRHAKRLSQCPRVRRLRPSWRCRNRRPLHPKEQFSGRPHCRD